MSREKLYEVARKAIVGSHHGDTCCFDEADFAAAKAAVDAVLANQPTIRVVESPPVADEHGEWQQDYPYIESGGLIEHSPQTTLEPGTYAIVRVGE